MARTLASLLRTQAGALRAQADALEAQAAELEQPSAPASPDASSGRWQSLRVVTAPKDTVRAWMKDGKVRARRVGREVWVSIDDLDAAIEGSPLPRSLVRLSSTETDPITTALNAGRLRVVGKAARR